MAIPKKITNFLEKAKVKYEPIEHRVVYTAYDKAATLKVPQKIVGKTLIVKLDKDFAFVLIPANRNLDKVKFKKVVNSHKKKAGEKATKSINFGTETSMKKNFKGIKIGATPPFGNLWKLPTFIDRGLFNNSKIVINAGDYKWSIKINPAYLKRAIPGLIVGSFGKVKK